MDNLALVLAVLALAVGGVAYWRSGGKQDVEIARQQIEEQIEKLQARQKELADTVAATTRAAYENLQERIHRAGDRLAELRGQAAESLQKQIDLATQQMERLQKRVADGIQSLQDSTVAVARETEEALARRVKRLEARVEILRAKFEINRALARAKDNDFEQADEYLREAVGLLKDARQQLGDDSAYDAKLGGVAEALRQAVAAVKAQAQDVRTRIEKVVSDSDSLLAALESDEQAAEVAAK